MRMYVCLVLLFGLTMGCGTSEEAFAGELTAAVVYGTDDRVEVFNHPEPDLRRIAEQSIVALIPNFRIGREENGTYTLFTESLKDLRGLCSDQQFGNQPTAAACSGVLIDDDLVLTAGHCIDSQSHCDSYSFVFNYYLDGPDHLATIQDQDVYSCARIVSQGAPNPGQLTPDFAVVQLDRAVRGDRSPAALRPVMPVVEQEALTMIGFGTGLPAKIDSGGSVADPRTDRLDFFTANLDAFQGHSGSATFDSQNRLAGILIGGRTPDYETYPTSDGKTCERVAVYQESQAGEVVHNIASIVAALCADGWDSEDLCGPKACEGGPCGSTPPPSGGSGAVSAKSSGCHASRGSTGSAPAWLGLFLFVVARSSPRMRP